MIRVDRFCLLVLTGGAIAGCAGDRSDTDAASDSGQLPALDSSRGPQRLEEPSTDPASGSMTMRAENRIRGTLAATGTAEIPSVTLRDDEGGAFILTGDLEGELARLTGAWIDVSGELHEQSPIPTFAVQSYVVLEIDGATPLVGVLSETDGGLQILAGSAVNLGTVPTGLREAVGAKVWILGPRRGDVLQVKSFGVIRDPP